MTSMQRPQNKEGKEREQLKPNIFLLQSLQPEHGSDMMCSREFFDSVLFHRERTKIELSEAENTVAGYLLGGIFSTDLTPDKNE